MDYLLIDLGLLNAEVPWVAIWGFSVLGPQALQEEEEEGVEVAVVGQYSAFCAPDLSIPGPFNVTALHCKTRAFISPTTMLMLANHEGQDASKNGCPKLTRGAENIGDRSVAVLCTAKMPRLVGTIVTVLIEDHPILHAMNRGKKVVLLKT